MNNLKYMQNLFKQNGIILAYLFGSQAEKGCQILQGQKVLPVDHLADLDLGIVFETFDSGPKHKLFASLYNQLDELFIPLKLDLVFLQETHSVFQYEAIKGVCIYAASEEIKSNYEHNALARAADFRWVLEQFYRERLEEMG